MRICDNGGWTDTWFARHGKVFNIAVYPYAEVQMHVYEHSEQRARITINAENYGERYTISKPNGCYEKHPLLEAAIDYMQIPNNIEIDVAIYSEAPSGCSTGTSAAVSVALIGALDTLTPGRLTPHEAALVAQKIETELLGQQCGIQDQIASAYGGINYIDMYEYPHATVSQIRVPERIWWELEHRLSLIFLGESHSSSDVHKKVISRLERSGSETEVLSRLRHTAEMSRDALYAEDLQALGKAMIKNTEAQRSLHPDLIGRKHQKVIDIAECNGAIGWKVNGAGGSGGSVTILHGSSQVGKRAMIRKVLEAEPEFREIPVNLCRFGLRVWQSYPA
jgi:D-glycero-alpha-D-manno-heptose-7-phosphate kinase